VSEIAIAARFEQVLRDNFGACSKRILAVNVFPLGSWVGGIFTTFCIRYCSIKGLNLTLVTPGNAPPEILRSVRQLEQAPVTILNYYYY
jgi:phenylacetate-CoA ligase